MLGSHDGADDPGSGGRSSCCRAVVVNFEAGDSLGRAVGSLLGSRRVETVVVVDNASSDDSLARLAALGFDPGRVVVIRNEVNGGFARACNQGAAACGEADVLLFNPDCVAGEGAIDSLCDILEAEPGAGAVGPLLLHPDGSEQAGGRRSAPTPWRSFVRAFGLTRLRGLSPSLFSDYGLETEPLPTRPVVVDALSGACMLLRRRALGAVGGLDEGYFLHCEDLDLCERLRRAGWTSFFVPGARVTHEKGVCSRSRPLKVEWHKHHGMWRYYRKFQGSGHRLPLRLLVGAGIWLRLAVAGVAILVRGVVRGSPAGGAQ